MPEVLLEGYLLIISESVFKWNKSWSGAKEPIWSLTDHDEAYWRMNFDNAAKLDDEERVKWFRFFNFRFKSYGFSCLSVDENAVECKLHAT